MSEQQNKLQNQDRAMAYLALQLGKMGGRAVGEPPTDEELAALSQRTLGDVRYAQVISHIASDSKIYHRWMRIGEAIALLDDKERALKRISAADNTSVIQRLGSWLFTSKRGLSVFGGGMATAAVLMLAIVLVPSLQQPGSIDDQFNYWKPYIDKNWEAAAVQPKYQREAADTRAFLFRSPYQKIFQFGFQTGAGELGVDRFEQLGIQLKSARVSSPPIANREVNEDQYNALMSLGRLTALTTLQCEMGIQANDFESLYHTAQLLSAKVYTVQDEKISGWAKTLGRQSEAQAQMQDLCRFSGDAVKTFL